MCGSTIREHNHDLLAVLVGITLDDVLCMLHTAVRRGGTLGREFVDCLFQFGRTRCVHSSQLFYDLSKVAFGASVVMVLRVRIITYSVRAFARKLHDGDAAVGGLLRHVVNEGIDGCLQGRDFGGFGLLCSGVELGVAGICVRSRGLGGQAGAGFTLAVSQVVLVIL